MSILIKNLSNNFKNADDNRSIAESALDKVVEDVIKENPTIDKIEALINILPKNYPAVRRLYELIYRKQRTRE